MSELANLIAAEADEGRIINVQMTTDGTGWNAELHWWPDPRRGLVLTTQNAPTPGQAVAILLDSFQTYRTEVENMKTLLTPANN